VAASSDTQSTINAGSNIMLAGIIFQLVATIAFSIFFLLFLRSFARDPQVDRRSLGKVKYLLGAIAISAAAIVIRGIYRTVELAQVSCIRELGLIQRWDTFFVQKWNGYLFVHQGRSETVNKRFGTDGFIPVWFLFDALPMVILMLVTLVAHPYFTLFPFWAVGEPPIVQRDRNENYSVEKITDVWEKVEGSLDAGLRGDVYHQGHFNRINATARPFLYSPDYTSVFFMSLLYLTFCWLNFPSRVNLLIPLTLFHKQISVA
jgi:hypothetical protein